VTDLSDSVLSTLRKHIAERRSEIAAKFPKHLGVVEYNLNVGRHQELVEFEAVMQAAIQKANGPDDETEVAE
jgi:hypothetical protein